MKRELDILTNENSTKPLHTYKNFPVFNGTTDQPANQDVFSDLKWEISYTTGVIQLAELLEPEVVYEHQTTTAAIGATWKKHR